MKRSEKIAKLQRIVDKYTAQLESKENGRFGRTVRLLGLTLAIADLQMELFAYGEDE
ncbi:hypothetical protein [Metasolibacillus sp.]|uniref:hypothetical protein n=1 Tax=Metasolibacillus sp. TaxID=2703680 RepID=UPI0025F16E67|nr:hypothetical protein [Metasolibacillus sp.]MCT6925418.1 hypothetical protein [Metasolibacillus sp.]MCT6941555.1 hypothetical protein [Metasolibacillus sp.]